VSQEGGHGVFLVNTLYDIHLWRFFRLLHHAREADEVGPEPECGPLSNCNTHGRRNSIEHSKHDSGEDGEGGDLIHRQGALRDKDGRGGDHETLNQILDNAVDNFSKSVAHHVLYSIQRKKDARVGDVLPQTHEPRHTITSLKHPSLPPLDMSTPDIVEDFLEEDTEIPGQRYVLLSFISPEKVLEKKDIFFFESFLKTYEVDWKLKNLEGFLVDTVKHINAELDEKSKELEKKDLQEAAEICRKNRLRIDDVMSQYSTYVQKNQEKVTSSTLVTAYDDFMFAKKTALEEEFYAKNEFRTSVRGVKIRGVFATQKEAEIKAKKLQGKDKYHNIFMGDVGKWTPWDPSPHEVKDQEYNNDQLNTLMKKYKENEDSREKAFEERSKGSSKQVFGSSTKGASDAMDGMFGGSDLALQRKMEKPVVTIERVDDSKEEPASSATAAVSTDAPKNVTILP